MKLPLRDISSTETTRVFSSRKVNNGSSPVSHATSIASFGLIQVILMVPPRYVATGDGAMTGLLPAK